MNVLRALTLMMVCVPLAFPASDFDGLIREFSRQMGVDQLHIPLLGMARFVVAVAHPAGTSELKLAIFEHVDDRTADFSRTADSVATGAGWNRMIRVREKRGEFTNIYMRPDGKRVQVLVATIDSGDATFVQVRVKPETLMRFVDEHEGRHRSH
jgi:hypothetical protein